MDLAYLDLCCLKRPFDDQRQPRVRSEAAAVADVLERAEQGDVQLVRSAAHRIENEASPREDRRLATALWMDGFAVDVPLTDDVERRARALGAMGFAPLGSLHLALAEAAHARWFVTCDDRMIGLAGRHRSEVATEVVSPLDVIGRNA